MHTKSEMYLEQPHFTVSNGKISLGQLDVYDKTARH